MGHGQKENNNDLESKESDNDEEDDPLNEFRAAFHFLSASPLWRA